MEPTLEQMCEDLRGEILRLDEKVLALKKHSDFQGEQDFENQHDEMMANIMLSYRHLEDARMRLGKVMQQIQGGVSIFDRAAEARDA